MTRAHPKRAACRPRERIAWIALLVSVAFPGCAFETESRRVQVDVLGAALFRADSCGAFRIELDDDPTWARRADDAELDEIGFMVTIENRTPLARAAELWVTPGAIPALTGDEARKRGFPILAEVDMPESSAVRIPYARSVSRQQHVSELHAAARSGTFYVYVLGAEPGYRFAGDELSLVGVFTAKR